MPATNTTYKVQFAGNAIVRAVHVSSAFVDVEVKWQVDIRRSASSVKVNKKVTITGTVSSDGDRHRDHPRKKGSGGPGRTVATKTLDATSQVLQGHQDDVQGHLLLPRQVPRGHDAPGRERATNVKVVGQVGPRLSRRASPARSQRSKRAAPQRGRPVLVGARLPRGLPDARPASRRRRGLISFDARIAKVAEKQRIRCRIGCRNSQVVAEPYTSTATTCRLCSRARGARTWENARPHHLSPVVVRRRSTLGSGGR